MFPQQGCYYRLKTSQLMSTEHLLTNTQTRAKTNTEGIIFWVLAPYQVLSTAGRQQVGWVSLLLLRVSPPTCFPSLSLRYTGLGCRKLAAEKAGWQGATTSNPKAQSWNAHIYTHPSRGTLHPWYTHTRTLPTHTIPVSSVPALVCTVGRLMHTSCQEYKCKKRRHCWNGQVQCSTLCSVPEVEFTSGFKTAKRSDWSLSKTQIAHKSNCVVGRFLTSHSEVA